MKNVSLLMLIALLVPAPVLGDANAPLARKAARVKYDPATIVSVSGTVLGELRTDHGTGAKSVRLIMKVGEDQVSVHLGPDTWVDRQKVRFAKGDEVTVRGSKFTYEGKYGLIAQSVTRGGDTLVLRDAAGKPAWSGQIAKQ
jgi:hypothetical protein